MAYDPIRDAPEFRATLRRLADIEHLTSQAIVDLLARHRTQGDTLTISRATLDRFIQGEGITKIRELRAIHDLLRTHSAYGAYFAPDPPAADLRARALAEVFGSFFGPDEIARDDPHPEDMAACLPGLFVMMRRDHDSISLDQGVRVSSLSLAAVDGIVAIEETQSYRTPDYDMPFEQTDKGFLFTHGRVIYFLMKEVGGTAVKFGVIEQTLPDLERRQPVQYFHGHLMVVSRRGVFPRTRFAARRRDPNQHPAASGIFRLGEIEDQRAVEHLRLDYVDGGAGKPA